VLTLKRNSTLMVSIACSLRRLTVVSIAGGMLAASVISTAHADSEAVPQNARVSAHSDLEAPADNEELSREYLIKAAILFNVAKFASWPDSAFSYSGAPLSVCVLGEDPFGAALESLHGKLVRNRPLVTARIDAIEDTPQCHILFVSRSEEGRLTAILDYVAELPILTVADIGRFANTGGIIALKDVDNRSRIEINLDAAERAGLRLSSKLLRLADTVSTQAAQSPVPTDAR